MVRCPKCAHEQTNTVECEACGLFFKKFSQVQDRRKGQANPQEGTRPVGTGLFAKIALVILLMGATAALTYYFTGSQKTAQTSPSAEPAVAVPVVARESSPGTETAVQTQQQREGDPALVRGSVIEQAKNATVSIETPWGKGSGFFITDTAVVTNKHVVAPDQGQVDEIRHKVETGRRLISLEQEKLAEMHAQLKQMGDGPTRQQLIIILQEREKELARILPNQKEAEERLARIDRPGSHTDIKIFLADGSEFSASATQISPNRDLALLTIYSAKANVLAPAPKNTVLHQGDRVYTVGNPVGLRNTVTSGIFSGYRQWKDTSEVLLQTDAPINPGNSGGPLIDELGLVHGVNTMIIQNTQGIGFAIPIQTVFEEFSIFRPGG